MATPKVCGTETEYGVHSRSTGDANPVLASSLLINAYVAEVERQVGWDFVDESPGNDARGFGPPGVAPEVETHLVNTVLTNGARFYVDHAHPEYSSPECASPLELVLFDRAGEVVLKRAMEAAARNYGPQGDIVVYKNNSDRKGNSYGCHENYLMDREVPFPRIAKFITPHFVTRIIYTGSGKVGSEVGSRERPDGAPVHFQLSQRAEFFEEEVGLETTLKRPIVNTRDEPHADPQKYRRLHVIVGDANLAEVATYLKVGVTALVLSMIEDDWLERADVVLANPVKAIRQVSYDVSLSTLLELASGRTATALDIQWELLDLAQKYGLERGYDTLGNHEAGEAVVRRWEETLSALEADPESLDRQLDWVAKKKLLEAYMDRHGLGWDAHRLAAMDLQYHDLRPEKSLFARLPMEKLVDPRAVERATVEPPLGTRAYFRGRCLQRWSASVAAANWDSLVFDLGSDPLRRVPMMEPLKGSASYVAELLEECATPAELLEKLGS